MVVALKIDSAERLHLYSTTSVRVANNVLTEQHIQRFRAQRNAALGWAAASTTPMSHYTPDTIALARGPLFWDIGAANAKIHAASASAVLTLLNSKTCTVCGFPFDDGATACACAGCTDINAKRGTTSKSSVAHDVNCWRTRGGRVGMLPADIEIELRSAWASKNYDVQLQYTKAVGFEVVEVTRLNS